MVRKKSETGDGDTEKENPEQTADETTSREIFGDDTPADDRLPDDGADTPNIFEDRLDETDGDTDRDAGADTVADTDPEGIASGQTDTPAGEVDDTIDRMEHSEDPIALVEDDTPRPVEDPVEEPYVHDRADEPRAAAHNDPQEEYEEVHGPSFASRALKFLLLLLVGAALGIWAAPRIAPYLPSGMAPVANWLTPGTNTTLDRISELETRIDSDLGSVSAQVQELAAAEPVNVEELLATAITRQSEEANARFAELEATVSDLNMVDTRQRLARLESSIEGQISELGAMKDQLTGGMAETSELSSEAVAQIDIYRAELEGLRGEMGTLSDQVSALGSRIDEVAATAERSISTAQARVEEIESDASEAMSAAAVEADLAQISAALSSARPFSEPVSRLEAGEVAVPEGLASAASGAPTLLMLRDSFPDAAHDAIRAGIVAGAEDQGFVARSKAYLEAQVATRSLTPQEGMDPDAVLSRMEQMLRDDDLAGAIAESENLASEAAAAMSGWLEQARLRLAADQGLSELRNSLPAVN